MSDTAKPAAPKAEASKTEAKSTPSASSEPTSSGSGESGSSGGDGGDGGEAGKSARESIGGAAVGHYGFFSNIKTPEYKSGWDDIWGKPEKSGNKTAGKKTADKKAAAKKKAPVTVWLDLEDLPAELQAGLADAARAQLKKMRVNYDSRDKAGAVTWRIHCDVER